MSTAATMPESTPAPELGVFTTVAGRVHPCRVLRRFDHRILKVRWSDHGRIRVALIKSEEFRADGPAMG